jgi:GDPmannose 4,6-dehydratase
MKILICGGLSQDSQVILELLSKENIKIDVIVRRSSGNISQNLTDLISQKKINLIYLDLTNTFELAKVVNDGSYSHIFNFASNSYVQNSNLDIHGCIKENHTITYNILNAILNANTNPWLMQPLSSEIFGNPDVYPQDEDTLIRPINAYGISKVNDMFLCDLYEDIFDLKIFRPILYNHESIYRGRQFFTKKIFNFVAQLKSSDQTNMEPLKFYNAKSKRDWGYAYEFCSIFYDAAQRGITGKFILGTGKSISVENFIEEVLNCYDIQFKKKTNSDGFLEFYDDHQNLIAGEVSRDLNDQKRNLVANSNLIKDALNIKVLLSGAEVIKKLYKDYEKA